MHRYGFTRVQRPAPATLRPPPQGNIEFSAQGDEAVRLSGGDRHRQASILQIGDERARKCWSPEDCEVAQKSSRKLASATTATRENHDAVQVDAQFTKFSAIQSSIHNHFNEERHFYRREEFKENRSAALAEWRQLAA
jgi:hypothetical protein